MKAFPKPPPTSLEKLERIWKAHLLLLTDGRRLRIKRIFGVQGMLCRAVWPNGVDKKPFKPGDKVSTASIIKGQEITAGMDLEVVKVVGKNVHVRMAGVCA